MHHPSSLTTLLSAARELASDGEDAITIRAHLRRIYPEALAADVARAVRGSGAP